MKKKEQGFLTCVVEGFTPFWLDVVNYKSKEKCCIFLKNKMSDAMRIGTQNNINSKNIVTFIVKKRDDGQGFYDFIRYSNNTHLGIKKGIEKKIAVEKMYMTINEGQNVVKGKGRSKLLTGRMALRNFDRTGDKISNAINSTIKKDKEYVEKNKFEEELRKLGL